MPTPPNAISFDISSSTATSRAFTLVELLVVISLVIMMMGLTAPAVRSMGGIGGLCGGSSKLEGLFEGARQNSISKGVLSAVVVLTGSTSGPNSAAWRTMAIFELAPKADGSMPVSSDWKQISKWEKLPTGIIIDNQNSTFLNGPTAPISTALPATLSYNGQTGINYSYQLYLPSGRLSHPPSPCNLMLVEGFYAGSSPTNTSKGNANYINFVFNDATGETKISRPN